MNAHKNVHMRYPLSEGSPHYGARHSTRLSDRLALVQLLQDHLSTAQELHRHILSLEVRARHVTFVEVRRMFHRLGEATEQCVAFLADRIHDLGAAAASRPVHMEVQAVPGWNEQSFAASLQHVANRTHVLAQFAAQIRSLMDKAVIEGDYNSLHVMTDCTYQISQLVALIQIHLPGEPASVSTCAPSSEYASQK
ncbi:hypothetical protein [Pseudomonas sp. NFR16]|uniref:hypothetical protein n=1 Tax=Pseudomonas sp. NFR16 TaxID=1566248 RepID=UPI0008B1C88A|nr:hypothetical protein [Pseudomonas sp. NFR16]SEJ48050.1 hypothetical protein SAMN03159495_3370 [Pseudomonas sp. NFR16]